MSSMITTTETTVTHRSVSKLREDKPAKLIRSSSIEKIRKLNNFICSQHYFFVPAVLNWLKSSKSSLWSSVETTIFLFRSLLFSAVSFESFLIFSARKQIRAFSSWLDLKLKSVIMVQISTYTAVGLVLLQLGICIYLLVDAFIPSGLVFLLVCMGYINLIYFKSLQFHMASKRIENKTKRD